MWREMERDGMTTHAVKLKRIPLSKRIGQRFGRLVITGIGSIAVNGKHKVETLCDCKKRKECYLSQLTGGETYSCGCLFREIAGSWKKKHGDCGSPEYKAWVSMIGRCVPTTKHTMNRKNYGDRLIGVCEEWKNSYARFLEDMGRKPSPSLSIDRIDNNLGYSRENCRWASSKEQSRNRSHHILVHFEGKVITAAECAERLNMPSGVVRKRIKSGWPIERLTEAVRVRGAGK